MHPKRWSRPSTADIHTYAAKQGQAGSTSVSSSSRGSSGISSSIAYFSARRRRRISRPRGCQYPDKPVYKEQASYAEQPVALSVGPRHGDDSPVGCCREKAQLRCGGRIPDACQFEAPTPVAQITRSGLAAKSFPRPEERLVAATLAAGSRKSGKPENRSKHSVAWKSGRRCGMSRRRFRSGQVSASPDAGTTAEPEMNPERAPSSEWPRSRSSTTGRVI
jgi:hypothetical protein